MFHRNQGFTILELVAVVAVAAVAVSLAVPSYQAVIERHRLISSSEQVSSFLAAAQSEAIKRNTPVSLSFTRDADDSWCIGAVQGDSGCDCTVTNAGDSDFCGIDGTPHRVDAALMGDLNLLVADDLQPNSGDARIVFDPVRGILDPPGDALLLTFGSSEDNYRLQVEIGPTGSLTVCAPAATGQVKGYPVCS